MTLDEIEEELSASRGDLEQAEGELRDALKAVARLTEEIEFEREQIRRLERRRRRRAVFEK